MPLTIYFGKIRNTDGLYRCETILGIIGIRAVETVFRHGAVE